MGAVAAGLWHVTPPMVAAAVAVMVGVLITGAFHEDGLADTADAFGGGYTVERRLEILKDPRHGSYGVAALSGSIVLRVLCLGALPGPAVMLAGAIAVHAMSRGAATVLMVAVRAISTDGLGADYTRELRSSRVLIAAAAAMAISIVAVGWWAAPLAAAGAVAAFATGWLARRKIGGISGDVLGACEQVAECLCLVVLTGLAARWGLWWR